MKILFVHQALQSFVQRDLEILRSAHDVREVRFRGLQDVPAVRQGTAWADLTFSWFGKLHALFAVSFSRTLGKPAVVVAGGDDVAGAPEIGYGMFAFWWKKWCPLLVFRYADLALPVSRFNREQTIRNTRIRRSRARLLYHGFASADWHPIDGIGKESLVLTVGRIDDETVVKKGLDLFVRSAAHLPHIPFMLVGPYQPHTMARLKAMAPANVTFAGGLYGRQLVEMYSRARVYVQVSHEESFGCSVAEAMLGECVPVVSRRAALPEVVGDCGFYVDQLAPDAVARSISAALAADSTLGQRARQRIEREFPLEKRREALLAAVAEVARH